MQDVSESGVASKPAYNNKINSPDKLRAAAAAAELESSYFFWGAPSSASGTDWLSWLLAVVELRYPLSQLMMMVVVELFAFAFSVTNRDAYVVGICDRLS